jgi:hypothetical protein
MVRTERKLQLLDVEEQILDQRYVSTNARIEDKIKP